jgi:protein-S-isoprenylcysteine O-methyltransferase Ste14
VSAQESRDVRRVLLPPVIALLCAGAAVGLGRLFPSPSLLPRPWSWIGVALILGAAALVARAVAAFRARRTTVVPHETPSALATEGPYRFTRNPMYLALATALVGVALIVGSAAALVAPAIFVIAVDRAFIRREERILERLFGSAYVEYKARVRRWI